MITIYEDKEEEEEIRKEPTPETIDKTVSSEAKDKLSDNILFFLKHIEEKRHKNEIIEEPKVHVSEVLGSLARLYEKVRNTVEYKGEHVLRRNAIERILKRLVWENENLRANADTKKTSETLVRELIWARYLANNSVPVSKVNRVEDVVRKYIYLLANLDNLPDSITPTQARSWIWGVASSEIEDVLDPSERELYVRLMHSWFNENYKWEDEGVTDHEKSIQIYLAIHRSFPKSDDAIMRYFLLLKEYPAWEKADREDIHKFILSFPGLYSEIESHLNHPTKLTLYRRIQKHSAAFDIFREVARQESSDLRKLFEDEKKLSKTINIVCDHKYQEIKKKVNTGIVRSIIYIFVSKVFFALFLEIPYEIYRYGDVRYTPLFMNIGVPPIMMWLVGLSIGIPGAKNTELISQKIKSVVYRRESKERHVFRTQVIKRKGLLLTVFGLLYAILFLGVFGAVSYLLLKINYSLFGLMVFFVFLSLVMLFAYRLRYNANQLKVENGKEGILTHMFDYLTLPFLNLGFHLSKAFSKLNFFTILLDFMIETPLKGIIEVFEEWTAFLREKKEEVVEVPDN